MSKVTPSALRGLSVAAGTVGLAAAGAAALAGQACAASSVTSGLPGGGLPVSTTAVPALLGALTQNQGAIAGIPLSSLPVVGQLPGMAEYASPASNALPGAGYAEPGSLPVHRSRPLPGTESGRTAHVPQHAAPVAGAPAPSAPAAPLGPPTSAPPQAAAPAPAAAHASNPQTGPLDSVTNALHNLPLVGQLVGGLPLNGLPIGGLAGGL